MIKRIKSTHISLILIFMQILFIVFGCTPGTMCTREILSELSINEKKNADFFVDSDIVYMNDDYDRTLFVSNDSQELIYIRMNKVGKYVKEGKSTTSIWMRNGKRILEGDPIIGGTYAEVPCNTLELDFGNDIHLVFESVDGEKYTMKSLLYKGVNIEKKKNPLGHRFYPVFYMKDVDLKIRLAEM